MHHLYGIISSSLFWPTRAYSGGELFIIVKNLIATLPLDTSSYSLLLVLVDLAQPPVLYKFKIQKWSLEYSKVKRAFSGEMTFPEMTFGERLLKRTLNF